MGDEQGDKPDHRPADSSNPVFVEPFKNDAKQDRRPTDEDGRTVEVGDGRSFLEIHAGKQPERVNKKGPDQKNHGGPAESLRPEQPGKETKDQNDDVQDHRLQKGLSLIEKEF